jgi:DNA end-binding protein Ku
MYTATSSHDVAFHQVHREDGGRIKYRRVCSVCGEEVSYDEIAKGYESPDGQLVILTDEDLADLPVSGSREIEVERFVPAEQIDPMLLERSYYLEPDRTGTKPYALLREALREADRMALVRVAIRNRSTMAVLRVRDDVIVLQTMLWPDEIRQAEFDTLADAADLRPQELAMAASLIDSMTGDYDPEEFDDDYRDAVVALLEAKVSGGDVSERPAARETASGGEVVDLLAALQRSVDQARSSRGEPAAERPAKETAAKETAAKKAAAKTATKRAPAKKAAKPAKKTAAKSTKGAQGAAKRAARRSA